MSGIGRREALVGIGTVGLAGWIKPSLAQKPPEHGGTLTIGFIDDTKTFDPTYSVQQAERQVMHLIYNTLIAIDLDFGLKPELAKSWTVENSGHRYVFQLQEGVSFQDGSPFNAEAVKYNFDRRLDEKMAAPQRKQMIQIIQSVEVLAPYSFAINLKTPNPGLLADLADRMGFMVSPAAAQIYGPDLGRNPIGTGAFTLKNWTQGTNITLQRNPNYWERNKVFLDNIIFRTIPNTAIGMQRLIVGEIDYINQLPPDAIKQLIGRSELKTEKCRIGRWYSLEWQVDRPPFDNLKLRQAIAYAIDRDRINQITMNGEATLANGPVPQGLWWSSPDEIVYNRDLPKAKALLAASGVAVGTEIPFWTTSAPLERRMTQLVAEQLGEIGLKVHLVPVSTSDEYPRQFSRAINFSTTNWAQRADPDGLLYILFDSKGYANVTGYKSASVDGWLESARTIPERDTRKKLYAQVKNQTMRDLPYVPLYFSAEFAAMKSGVHNVLWMPDNNPRYRYAWKFA